MVTVHSLRFKLSLRTPMSSPFLAPVKPSTAARAPPPIASSSTPRRGAGPPPRTSSMWRSAEPRRRRASTPTKRESCRSPSSGSARSHGPRPRARMSSVVRHAPRALTRLKAAAVHLSTELIGPKASRPRRPISSTHCSAWRMSARYGRSSFTLARPRRGFGRRAGGGRRPWSRPSARRTSSAPHSLPRATGSSRAPPGSSSTRKSKWLAGPATKSLVRHREPGASCPSLTLHEHETRVSKRARNRGVSLDVASSSNQMRAPRGVCTHSLPNLRAQNRTSGDVGGEQ